MNLSNTYILRNTIVSSNEVEVNQNIEAYKKNGAVELTKSYADGLVKQVTLVGDSLVITFRGQ